MRQYTMQEKKSVAKVICNQCGKEIAVKDGDLTADVLHVDKRWGYFSDKDNEQHSFDLCEECYDRLIQNFKIPVDTEE